MSRAWLLLATILIPMHCVEPMIRVWELTYSEQDIEESWQMILSAKRGMEQELAARKEAA